MSEDQVEGHDYVENEPIGPINEHRKKRLETQRKQEELKKLREERLEVELKVQLRRERERIQKAKDKLYGKKGQVYCDDCHKWVYPNHFD